MTLVIWQGFDHSWQREAHRLTRISSWIEQAEASDSHHPACRFASTMQIGRFPPDISHTHAMVHRSGSASSARIDGVASAVLRGRLGERVEVEGEMVSHELPAGDLTATVVMRGFELASSFPPGFQTRGFGFRLSDIRQHARNGPAISFVPGYFIFPERSPDPATNPDHVLWRVLPFPPALEPRSPDEFEYEMKLHYSVIYDRARQARFTYHDVREGPVTSRSVGPGTPRKAVHRTLTGEAGGAYGSASVGIRGFRWELLDWPQTRWDGRYLRKIQCMLDGQDYDPQGGRMTVSARMEFNNFGGVQGREQVRRWIAFLRAHRKRDRNRLRAIARSLRLSYGFIAEYSLSTTLLQFKSDTHFPASHLYNVVRKNALVKQDFIV